MAKTQENGFFEKYGIPTERKVVAKRIDAKTLFLQGIAEQETMLDGMEVFGKKGSLVRNWFRNGSFIPAIGKLSLLSGKEVKYQVGTEKEVLMDFKKNLVDGYFDDMIQSIESKRQAKADRIMAARSKRKK